MLQRTCRRFLLTSFWPQKLGVNTYLQNIATEVIYELETEGCCETEYTVDDDAKDGVSHSDRVSPCVLGHIASYYYLTYRSVGLFDRM